MIKIKERVKALFNFLASEPACTFLYNFLLVMIVFMLFRIFFFAVNRSYFPDVDTARLLTMLKGGLLFDLSALLYINLLYMLMQLLPFPFKYNRIYQTIARWIFWITNSAAIIVNSVDIPFFRFTNRRMTASIYNEFSNESIDTIYKIFFKAMLAYWYVTLFTIIAIVLLWLLYRKPRKNTAARRFNFLYYLAHTAVLAIFAYYTVIGLRGGFGRYTRPVTISNANKYVNSGTETAIVLNTPFCLFRTLNKKTFVNPHYFDNEAAMTALYSPVHHPKPQGEFKPLNVVIIIWESFGKESTGFFNHNLDNGTYKGFTPFMDSLFAQGLTFQYSYANGRKSIDAMPSILSSIPMFVEPFFLTSYSTNDLSSIAEVLKQKGYYSAFFHGAPNGSMGFEAYAKAAGFDDYFGYDEYNNSKDYDGTWAIWDEEFLQFYASEMGKMKQPFITSVFTASSHHPFQIPEKYEGKFPEGKQPILHAIAYTDYAMRRFFQKMSQYEWYNNTLFVITADHTHIPVHDEYFTDIGRYSVPILFYHPGSNLRGLVDSIPVQQIDIMPTVLSYLNFDKPYFSYGQDILTTQAADKFVINYDNGTYQLLKGDYLQDFDGEKTKAVYNYKTDIFLRDNLAGKVEGQDKTEELTKSVIQQYLVRMLENRLSVSEKDEK